jgi:hypothetical protein
MTARRGPKPIEVDDQMHDETEADGKTAVATRKPFAGVVLPEGFVNPPLGEHGHLCLDPQKRYQPTWSCVFISRSREMPERQFFLNEKAQPIYVQTDAWVDVPPSVVAALQSCRESRITRGSLQNEGLMMAMQEVASAPLMRFQFSVIPSA